MSTTRILYLCRAKLWGLYNWRRAYYMAMFESALYLLLLGSGLSRMIGTVTVAGTDMLYTEFLFAGLIGMQSFRVFSYTLFTCSNDLKWGMYRLYIQAGATPLEYSLARSLNALVHMAGQLSVLLIAGLVILGPASLVRTMPMLIAAFPAVLFWAFLGVAIGTRIQDYGTRDMVSSMVVLPVAFSSSAFYDMTLAPVGLRWVSKVNPLSYTVDAMRLIYIGHWAASIPFLVAVLTASVAVLAIANYLLPLRNLVAGQRG